MENFRRYGSVPFRIAVVHGGPGAPGEMAPVARELARDHGALEPLQTADTVAGQVEELRATLEEYGAPPITLIGSSWGAMLGFILSARHPALVHKLIMVGSAVFEKKYASGIMATRLSRLTERERLEVGRLQRALDDPATAEKDAAFVELGRLIAKADSYDPLPEGDEPPQPQYDVYRNVWREAEQLRDSGDLLDLGKQVRCPVVAIHGDYDPHPAEGVENPLSSVVRGLRFVLLANCGHHPWAERQARERFFAILTEELV